MTRPAHLLSMLVIAMLATLASPPHLFAHGSDQPDRDALELRAALAQEAQPETVTINFHTYGFSVAPQGPSSLLTLRLVGPKRTLFVDERTTGESIDWSLPGGAPDGSYRYEVFVSTPSLNGTPEGHLTPGGFEVLNGQILQP